MFFPANNTCVAAVVHRLVFLCKGGRWTENLTLCLPPFAVLSHFLLFFVLHVQFCKAKSRCTLSQVVHQQHSVTVSYHYVNMPPPPISSPFLFICLSPLPCRYTGSPPDLHKAIYYSLPVNLNLLIKEDNKTKNQMEVTTTQTPEVGARLPLEY